MTQGIVLIGAGGHAKVCIELLQAMGETVAFCVGSDAEAVDCHGIPVLNGDVHLLALRAQGFTRAFVAIGNNQVRQRLGAQCIEQGYRLVNAISPHAVISPSASLGAGVAVMAGAIIQASTTIGDWSIINTGASVDHDCQLGQAVHVAPQCALAGNVTVGDLSFLGIGSRVIPGIRIGSRTVVGAGAVVVRDLDNHITALGVPAKPIHPRGSIVT